MEHVLFHGPPGLGKTTLAHVISKEKKSNLVVTSGPSLEKPADIVGLLSNLSEGDVLDQVMGVFNYSFGTYKIQIRDVADLGITMGFDDDFYTNPYEYALHENFPNPFNPETQIRFSIGGEEAVKLIIYDNFNLKKKS